MKAHRRGDLQRHDAAPVIDSGLRPGYVSSVGPPKRARGRSAAYANELKQLNATYTLVRSSANQQLSALVERLADAPTVFVGSGGAFTLAQLAADLHQHYTGHLGRAMTPLECSTTAFHGDTAIVMFTASGRHPDAALTIRAAKRTLPSTIAVVTLRREDELPADLRGDRVTVVTIPCPVKQDGFLATNSVLAIATALVRAYAPGDALPGRLPSLDLVAFELRERCLVLFPPQHSAIGFDLEARLHETGLAAVQLADYRNFAHGRHAGLARRLDETTIIGVIEPAHEDLARRTLEELPGGASLQLIETGLSWPCSVVDLLAASMKLIVPAAERQRLNPAKPGVALFGRHLYHLKVTKEAGTTVSLPVARKLVSMGRARIDASIQGTLEEALREWLVSLSATRLDGIVLDYDGTCCTTEGRYSLPDATIQMELQRVLELGLPVGFASGRGGSLHRDLRKWVPRKHWNQIVLGLYNGAVLLALGDELADQSRCRATLAEARDRLLTCSFSHLLAIEAHEHQVEVRLKSPRSWGGTALSIAVQEIVHRCPILPVKVVASAHSVDIVENATSKRAVLDLMRGRCDGGILAIGDQGHVGGNDFEMLAAMTSTLSVDRCSGDATRCWNLDDRGHRGPALLVRYLQAIRKSRGGARLLWSAP